MSVARGSGGSKKLLKVLSHFSEILISKKSLIGPKAHVRYSNAPMACCFKKIYRTLTQPGAYSNLTDVTNTYMKGPVCRILGHLAIRLQTATN